MHKISYRVGLPIHIYVIPFYFGLHYSLRCMQDVDMFWDFISLRPETTHQVSFLFSDRGIPDGYRHMNGYGSHTFKMVSKDGQPVYCKFHYKVHCNVL